MVTPTRSLPWTALLLAAGALVAGARCASAPLVAGDRCDPPGAGPLQLAWQDEFDGPAGSSPLPADWTFDVGTGDNGWGNGQLEFDTARPENAGLDGLGHLAIVARRESYGSMAYTSARMTTRGLHQPCYGKIEARIKLPRGAGLWPAFWMLGADVATSYWPACGEIDVMEYLGQNRFRVFATAHGPGYSGAYGISGGALDTSASGVGFDEDFHTYAVEWDPQQLRFLVDGVQLGPPVTPASLPHDTSWVFDHPFFVILNLAVGGTLGGPVAVDTVFPATMLVDWVRVSSRASR